MPLSTLTITLELTHEGDPLELAEDATLMLSRWLEHERGCKVFDHTFGADTLTPRPKDARARAIALEPSTRS